MAAPRKVRRDATLKDLPHEFRVRVLEWLDVDGWQLCVRRIFSELGIASPKDPEKPISRDTLYKALSFWRAQEITDEAFAFRDAQQELMAKFKPGDARLAREFGEFSLLQRANQTQDKDIFMVATMAQDASRRAAQEDVKIGLKKKQIEQKDKDISLAERKFQRDTCELFLEWHDNEKAKQIATSGLSNAEKIEQLGLAMFGEDWKA